jgi:hypothetical protein
LTTEHPKVTAYVPQPILDALDSWKSQNNIDSRSAALVAILADYLAVAYSVRHPSTALVASSNLPGTVLAELAKLSERVTALEQQIQSSTALSNSSSTVLASDTELGNIGSLENIDPIDEARSTPPSTVPLEEAKTTDEALGTVPGKVLRESTGLSNKASGNAPSTVPMAPLSQAALAKRLGCSDKAIEKHRKLGDKESFAKWSRDRDPDSIAWIWEGSGGRGQPLRFMPHLELERNV